jgi:hypothetical protein
MLGTASMGGSTCDPLYEASNASALYVFPHSVGLVENAFNIT